jgi:hypothetical protein
MTSQFEMNYKYSIQGRRSQTENRTPRTNDPMPSSPTSYDLQTNKKTKGRAMAQVVSRWPLTVEARVCARVTPYEIYDRQSGTETVFSPGSSVLPCQYHSIGGMNSRHTGGRSSQIVSPHRHERQLNTKWQAQSGIRTYGTTGVGRWQCAH